MCDPHHHNCRIPPDDQISFYRRYMQQHATMMSWIQQLHQNIPFHASDFSYFQSDHPENMYRSCPQENSDSTSSSTSKNDEKDVQSSRESNNTDESEYEFELNVEAILAMRAAKEELSKKSSDGSESFEIPDFEIEKEEFEFVELGSLKTLESNRSCAVGNVHNKAEELETEKKIMEYLYGEKSATIAGLETAMAINFQRLYDTHQPPLWPVLPVRL